MIFREDVRAFAYDLQRFRIYELKIIIACFVQKEFLKLMFPKKRYVGLLRKKIDKIDTKKYKWNKASYFINGGSKIFIKEASLNEINSFFEPGSF